MNVTFACPQCDATNRADVDEDNQLPACTQCGYQAAAPPGATAGGKVHRCLVCPSTELYTRKDFSQRLGLIIIVSGFLASSVAWYFYMKYLTFGILVATALVDVILYLAVGNMLQCYRCHTEYRGVAGLDEHDAFRLETHERFRQQAARLATPSRGAPAPRGDDASPPAG